VSGLSSDFLSQTITNEAFLLGTREELAAFAHTILRHLDAPSEQIDYLGIITRSPIDVDRAALTHVMSEVVLDCLLIVKDKNDRRTLMNKILANNGEGLIDWEEFDKAP